MAEKEAPSPQQPASKRARFVRDAVLPIELWDSILSFIPDPVSITNVASTSKKLAAGVRQLPEEAWNRLYHRRSPSLHTNQDPSHHTREEYIARHQGENGVVVWTRRMAATRVYGGRNVMPLPFPAHEATNFYLLSQTLAVSANPLPISPTAFQLSPEARCIATDLFSFVHFHVVAQKFQFVLTANNYYNMSDVRRSSSRCERVGYQ